MNIVGQINNISNNSERITDKLPTNFAPSAPLATFINNGTNRTRASRIFGSLVREQRINTPMGEMVLNPVLQTIISKIVFLLRPNMQDKVFTNQLGNKLKRLLTDESKHGVKV